MTSTSKPTTLIQSNTIQVYFSSVRYIYMCATRFGLYLGNPRVCQYKSLDTIRM